MGLDLFVGGNSAMEQFIQSTLQLEAQPRFRLVDQQSALKNRTNVLTDLQSKLSKLHTLAKRFTDVITNPFDAKAASSSDEKIFSASASSGALTGSHSLDVLRLASSDTRVSQQYTSTATDLRSFFDTNGSQTFQIDVGHPTTADSTNRVSISVTVNPIGADNDSILKEVAVAINDAMNAAATAGTIDADEKASASVVHEQNGTARLIFKSGQSGFTNRLSFVDSAASFLSTTQITNNVLSAGTAGGFVTSVGTTAADSQLNAELKVDGLTFYRDSNSITDVLDNVTLTLKNITTTQETLEIKVDTEKVKQELEELISVYNDVVNFVKAKTTVDSTTNTRGALANDSNFRGLRSTLRGIVGGQVSSAASGNPQSIFELGVTSSSDGTLSLTDTTKLDKVLATGSSAVSDIFRSQNGIAAQLKTTLDEFVKVGGTIDDSKSSVDDRLRGIDARLKRFDKRLGRRETQLRKQFSRMQETAALLGGQSNAFSSIFSSIRF